MKTTPVISNTTARLDKLIAETPIALPQMPAPRLRLEFLDGLRGLAALFVVIHHAYFETTTGMILPHLVQKLTYWLFFGRASVDVFIVLSGFCLMLPVVLSPTRQLSGGLKSFVARRARRILPPYYAALGLSLLLLIMLPPLSHQQNFFLQNQLPLNVGVVASHLLLVHNLSPAWSHNIDYPMWSVATEWQIYFVFAFLLLPIWRRFGGVTSLLVAFLLGFALIIVHPASFAGACAHFLGLFALGMFGAEICLSPVSSLSRLRDRLPWGVFSIGFFLAIGIVYKALPKRLRYDDIATDILVGFMSVCLIIFCFRYCHATVKPWVLRVLESRFAVSLGLFSYSLYLVHAPVLGMWHYAMLPLHLHPTETLLAMLGIGVPLSVLVAYGFHRLFELPFMTKPTGRPWTFVLRKAER